MCRAGQVEEAYKLAKEDFDSNRTNPWTQRELGWALYYLIKNDAESKDLNRLIEHIDELKTLDLLTIEGDSMIYDNVQLQIASFINNHLDPNDPNAPQILSTFFHKLKDYHFTSSLGHSVLLRSYLRFSIWDEMAYFFDWWNLDTFRQEDYKPFVMQNGKSVMSLAERAFIANSKVLLRLNNVEQIKEFLPKLNNLMTLHPEMMYPGYYYGKLLLKLGSNSQEALNVIIPFARRKASEFWVWQLLSEVFIDDKEKQMACLLRAVHCRTENNFLVNVRKLLASLYIEMNQLGRARYHIDLVISCCTSNNWRLSDNVINWISQPWFNTTEPDKTESINFLDITNKILYNDAEKAIAVVTYVDPNSKKATIIYGHKKRSVTNLRIKVDIGSVLEINYIINADGKTIIPNATKTELPDNLEYAKVIEGTVDKKDENDFAFLKSSIGNCFISPNVVKKYNLTNKEKVKALVVCDYNKKKDTWSWSCVSIKR